MSNGSVSRSSRWLLLAVLVAAAYWILDLAILRAGIPHPLDDTWEDGLVARSLLEGEGWRSSLIYPPLWELRDPGTMTIPVLVHGPLLPLLIAGPLDVLGPRVLDNIALAGGFVAWLTVFPLFWLGARLLDEPRAAATTLLFTLSPLLLEAVHHSVSEVFGALLLTLALERLMAARHSHFVPGLLMGLAYLVRTEMTMAAVILLMALLLRARKRGAAVFAAGFALVAAPWWAHNLASTGSPLFNLSTYLLVGYWGDRPRYTVLMDYEFLPSLWLPTLVTTLPSMWPKWLFFFPRAVWHLLEVPAAGTGWLALVGAGFATRIRGARAWVFAAFALAVIPIAIMTMVLPQVLHVVPFMGLWALAAVEAARRLSTWVAPRTGHAALMMAGLAILTLPFTALNLVRATREARITELLVADERQALVAVTDSESQRTSPLPMFSDRPGFVAWTTHRPTIYTTEAEYERLFPSSGPIESILPRLPRRWGARDTWVHDGHWARGRRAGEPPSPKAGR